MISIRRHTGGNEVSANFRTLLTEYIYQIKLYILQIYIYYEERIQVFPLLRMCSNRCKYVYKTVALNFPLSCQYHSAQQLTAEQQHRQLYIYTASCCVLREDHSTVM